MDIRFLEKNEWALIAPLFEAQGAPVPCPEWAKVLVALEGGKVVGLLAIQLVPHVEPIIIDRAWQGTGLAKEMSEMVDGYMAAVGVAGAYTQPMREGARRIARAFGYEQCEAPLFAKIYRPGLERLAPQMED